MAHTVDSIPFTTNDRPVFARACLLIAITATCIGAIEATKLGLPHSVGGAQVRLSEALIRSIGIWWLWALLTPIVFCVARRWHPERVGLARASAAHVGGAIVVSMSHSLIYVPVMLALVWPELLPELGGVWRRNLVGNVFGDLVTYAGLTAVWYAFDYRRAQRAAELRLTVMDTVAAVAEPAQVLAPRPEGGVLQRIPVRASGRVILIPVSDVEWIEASGDYAVLHCRDRQHLAAERIASLSTALDPAVFVRVHRSAIVRIDQIRELRPRTHGDYDVVLASGRLVRLSRTYRGAVAASLGVDL